MHTTYVCNIVIYCRVYWSWLFLENTWLHANIYPSNVIFHWIFNDSHGKCAPDSSPKDKLALINYKLWKSVCFCELGSVNRIRMKMGQSKSFWPGHVQSLLSPAKQNKKKGKNPNFYQQVLKTTQVCKRRQALFLFGFMGESLVHKMSCGYALITRWLKFYILA